LESIDSCTLSDLTNTILQDQLNMLAERAIADFKFPKYSLAYVYDSTVNPASGIPYGYYFTELDGPLTQKEYNVIVAHMKKYWVEFQISQERLFQNAYYDKDIRLHSPGNTLDKLDKMYKTFIGVALKAERDYSRVNTTGVPTWGDINE
jgi:hypothetical protein